MDNSSADAAGAGHVRAVARALEVLQAFREDDVELSASDLLARVTLSRPTLYRLLYTLVGGSTGRNAWKIERLAP